MLNKEGTSQGLNSLVVVFGLTAENKEEAVTETNTRLTTEALVTTIVVMDMSSWFP